MGHAFIIWGVPIALIMLLTASASALEAPERFGDVHRSEFLQRRRAEELLDEPTFRSLWNAYCALQAWKQVITRDPQGITSTWKGQDVCTYKGVFCSPSPTKPNATSDCGKVVTGIDLNHGNISGVLPEALGLITDLVLFHINTNFFTGTIPQSFKYLTHLFELDVSNNLLSGGFPMVTMSLPSLQYLDLRFNQFSGPLPSNVFTVKIDALFVNSNKFTTSSTTLSTIGSSTASVIVLANNGLKGSIPASIGQLNATLEELLLLGNNLDGCIPETVGNLTQLKVFDVGNNSLGGEVPSEIACMRSLEQLNLADNLLSGPLPPGICELPKLKNLTISGNYIIGVEQECKDLPSKGINFDDRENCILFEDGQRSPAQCEAFLCLPTSCYPRPVFPPPPY